MSSPYVISETIPVAKIMRETRAPHIPMPEPERVEPVRAIPSTYFIKPAFVSMSGGDTPIAPTGPVSIPSVPVLRTLYMPVGMNNQPGPVAEQPVIEHIPQTKPVYLSPIWKTTLGPTGTHKVQTRIEAKGNAHTGTIPVIRKKFAQILSKDSPAP